MSPRHVACALLHHPVLGRDGQTVTSAITNIDLHDISRSALSFGLSAMYVVHPVEAQRVLATRIREHWVEGSGGLRIPDRKPALTILRIVTDLQTALDDLEREAGQGPPEIWTTSARPVSEKLLDFAQARSQLGQPGPPVLLVFGTGWGLAPEIHERATAHLTPIESPRSDGYNHLSVRAAAAILFDRLCGVR